MIKQVLKAAIVSVSCSNAKDAPTSRVTWITPKPIAPKPTEAPTYEFPTETPVIQQSSAAGHPTEPPFFTTLPSKAPSLSTETSPSINIQPSTITYGQSTERPSLPTISPTSLSTKSGKSSKDTKALKIPPFIESPTYSPSDATVLTTSPQPLCSSAKWHPDISFLKCSNSLDYPEDWSSTPDMKRHFFRSTLEQCCEFVFGLTGSCEFEDVCTISSPTISPTDSFSETAVSSSTNQMADFYLARTITFDTSQLPTIEQKIETANPSMQDSQVSFIHLISLDYNTDNEAFPYNP